MVPCLLLTAALSAGQGLALPVPAPELPPPTFPAPPVPPPLDAPLDPPVWHVSPSDADSGLLTLNQVSPEPPGQREPIPGQAEPIPAPRVVPPPAKPAAVVPPAGPAPPDTGEATSVVIT